MYLVSARFLLVACARQPTCPPNLRSEMQKMLWYLRESNTTTTKTAGL